MAYTKVGSDGKETVVKPAVEETPSQSPEVALQEAIEATDQQPSTVEELPTHTPYKGDAPFDFVVNDDPLRSDDTKNEYVAIQLALFLEKASYIIDKAVIRELARMSKNTFGKKSRVKGWPAKNGEIPFCGLKLGQAEVVKLFYATPDVMGTEWITGYEVKKILLTKLNDVLKKDNLVLRYQTPEEKKAMAPSFELLVRSNTAVAIFVETFDEQHITAINGGSATAEDKTLSYIIASIRAMANNFMRNYMMMFDVRDEEFYKHISQLFFSVAFEYAREHNLVEKYIDRFDVTEKASNEESVVKANQNENSPQSSINKENEMTATTASNATGTATPATVEINVNTNAPATPVAATGVAASEKKEASALVSAIISTPEATELDKFLAAFDEKRKIEKEDTDRKISEVREEVASFKKAQNLNNVVTDKRLERIEEKVFGASAADMIAKIREEAEKETAKTTSDDRDTVYVTSGLTTTETIMVASATVAVVAGIGIGVAYLLQD